MMNAWRFVQPVDTLSLRGNKLFGAAGDFGASTETPNNRSAVDWSLQGRRDLQVLYR